MKLYIYLSPREKNQFKDESKSLYKTRNSENFTGAQKNTPTCEHKQGLTAKDANSSRNKGRNNEKPIKSTTVLMNGQF